MEIVPIKLALGPLDAGSYYTGLCVILSNASIIKQIKIYFLLSKNLLNLNFRAYENLKFVAQFQRVLVL